jgi:hypothetical protein
MKINIEADAEAEPALWTEERSRREQYLLIDSLIERLID